MYSYFEKENEQHYANYANRLEFLKIYCVVMLRQVVNMYSFQSSDTSYVNYTEASIITCSLAHTILATCKSLQPSVLLCDFKGLIYIIS